MKFKNVYFTFTFHVLHSHFTRDNGPYVIYACVHAQLLSPVCDAKDYSLSGSSVHGIFQARILEWVAMPFSRGPRAGEQDAKVRTTVKAV